MGLVRIIGGKFKRTPLPVDDRQGLRPTPERVRETVFDWLTHLFDCDWSAIRALDLFGGSGAMGLEAASRGAAYVLINELNRKSAGDIGRVVQKIGAADVVTVRTGDAFSLKAESAGLFDVIFIDPPFAADLQERASSFSLDFLKKDGLVYVENEREMTDEQMSGLGLTVVRRGKAGAVCFLLARKKPAGSVG